MSCRFIVHYTGCRLGRVSPTQHASSLLLTLLYQTGFLPGTRGTHQDLLPRGWLSFGFPGLLGFHSGFLVCSSHGALLCSHLRPFLGLILPEKFHSKEMCFWSVPTAPCGSGVHWHASLEPQQYCELLPYLGKATKLLCKLVLHPV